MIVALLRLNTKKNPIQSHYYLPQRQFASFLIRLFAFTKRQLLDTKITNYINISDHPKKTYKNFQWLIIFSIQRNLKHNQCDSPTEKQTKNNNCKCNFYLKCIYIRIHCNWIDLRNIYLEQMDEFTHRTSKKIFKRKNCLADIYNLLWYEAHKIRPCATVFNLALKTRIHLVLTVVWAKHHLFMYKRIYLTYAGVSQSKKKSSNNNKNNKIEHC